MCGAIGESKIFIMHVNGIHMIETFQIEGMIALITKMTLIFSSDLLYGQKQLSKNQKFSEI